MQDPDSLIPRPSRPVRDDPYLLTVAEVAARLSLSPRTVYQLAATGSLRAVRIGRAVRIPTNALDAFLEENGGR